MGGGGGAFNNGRGLSIMGGGGGLAGRLARRQIAGGLPIIAGVGGVGGGFLQ